MTLKEIDMDVLEQGDWLIPYNSDEPHRVKEISYQEEPAGRWTTITFEGKDFWGVWHYPSYCKPIALTEDLLRLNGFTHHAYGYSLEDLKIHGNIDESDTVYFTIDVAGRDMRIDYVHQLQHALRLCGINKEITIK